MANRPHIKIKNKNKVHPDKCGNTREQKCHAQGSRKQTATVHAYNERGI
jgi:hypothetical protein